MNMLYMKFDQKNMQNMNMRLFLHVKYFKYYFGIYLSQTNDFLNYPYLFYRNFDFNILYMKFYQKNVWNLNMMLILPVKYF